MQIKTLFTLTALAATVFANPIADPMAEPLAGPVPELDESFTDPANYTLEARQDSTDCNAFTQRGRLNDAATCRDRLDRLGSQPCRVFSNGAIQMCHAGTVRVFGVPRRGISETQSACRDVAAAVDYQMRTCGGGGMIGSRGPARGNGDLIVEVRG